MDLQDLRRTCEDLHAFRLVPLHRLSLYIHESVHMLKFNGLRLFVQSIFTVRQSLIRLLSAAGFPLPRSSLEMLSTGK